MATTAQPTPLGTPLPEASLTDASGQQRAVHELAGQGPVLVAFLANHCPYVQHIETTFGSVTADLAAKGLTVIGVSSNDATSHPQDGPGGMLEQAQRAGFTFPYLRDEDQRFALALGAACTPDLFLFDRDHRLAYRGAFDGATPGNEVPVTGDELRAAATALLRGAAVADEQRPAMGCSIKWSPGNAPA